MSTVNGEEVKRRGNNSVTKCIIATSLVPRAKKRRELKTKVKGASSLGITSGGGA